MNRFNSLSTRLVVAMLIPLSLLLLLATWYETRRAAAVLIQTGEVAAQNLGATVKEELQGVLRSTRTGVEALAIGLEQLPGMAPESVGIPLREALERFPLMYGSTLAFERSEDQPPLAPYVYRQDGDIRVSSLADEDYAYWNQPWFTEPLARDQPVWTAPYEDEGGGNVRMVTYAVPLEINGRRAVLTADLSLDFLSEIAGSSLLGRPGAVLVFDRDGQLIAHPREDWLLRKPLGEIGRERQVAALGRILPAVAQEKELWLRPDDAINSGVIGEAVRRPGRLLIVPLKEAGWGIGIYFSDEDFLADIKAATRFRLLFSLALLILLAATLAFVSLRGLRPLGELAERTRAIARGEFHGKTPGQERKDEIGQLSRAFQRMQEQLKHFIEDLTKATAARERLDAELTTARLLQHALLPAEKPPADVLGADICALLHSAREVGGDLFNYSRREDGRLFFVIGDVSDKGVPAALFMTRTNALLKAAAAGNNGPEAVLRVVNQALSEENELCMFVTLLAGELELATGQLTLASAGHDAPFLVSAAGEVSELALESGPPVGIDEDADFPRLSVTLAPGDCLVTFTDGVTEARSPDGELFETERLRETLATVPRHSAADLVDQVSGAVEAFAAGAEQADDLTLLVIRRLETHGDGVSGPDEARSGSLDFALDGRCHERVTKALAAAMRDIPGGLIEAEALKLVMEEVLTNIVKYSGAAEQQQTGSIHWQLTDSELALRIEDPGQPFNPLEDAEESLSDEERCEGGMGLMLVRAMADTIRYRRVDGKNRLELAFRAD